MYFVGRKKEIHTIVKSLETGQNIVLTGKFGIGRTSLIHHISDLLRDQFHFIFTDFSKTAKAICEVSLAELGSGRPGIETLHFKTVRSKLVRFDASDARRVVLVMDNIARLTPQKFNLIRYLKMQSRFQFVAITELFLKTSELDKLRGQMLPAVQVGLSYLPRADSVDLLRHLFRAYGIDAGPEEIDFLAASTHGYPLGIQTHFRSRQSR
jgi:AAA+ ATPase superfamily predicted ATPase